MGRGCRALLSGAAALCAGAATGRHTYGLAWFFRNLHELLIVALPLFRPLRLLLRLVTLLSVLHRTLGDTLRGRVATYVVGSATMLVFVGALAVLDVEQPVPDAKFGNTGTVLEPA